LGEPGVGKSAIAEGLALRIIQKKVSLFNKRVVTLDLASLVGTKYRGQFEERYESSYELEKNDDIILH
jgi:ATP-dependent Clp protease ATP-binding subunit ClpA